jgi:NAD(P)-dependent dehydrogenase (short-subunit alcohol dehydrogenase family)
VKTPMLPSVRGPPRISEGCGVSSINRWARSLLAGPGCQRPLAVAQFVAAVEQRFGRVDICITNTGGPPSKLFAATTRKTGVPGLTSY